MPESNTPRRKTYKPFMLDDWYALETLGRAFFLFMMIFAGFTAAGVVCVMDMMASERAEATVIRIDDRCDLPGLIHSSLCNGKDYDAAVKLLAVTFTTKQGTPVSAQIEQASFIEAQTGKPRILHVGDRVEIEYAEDDPQHVQSPQKHRWVLLVFIIIAALITARLWLGAWRIDMKWWFPSRR